MFIVVILLCLASSGCFGCHNGSVAVFQLSFVAEWSRSKFPKQFPRFRPSAQWAPIVGITHSANVTLWRQNHPVTDEFRDYVQNSKTEALHSKLIQASDGGVMNSFESPRISKGDGFTFLRFSTDDRHHLLSFATRLIPSPDWFVGLDSQDLCHNSTQWKSSLTVDLYPLDAGTDNGFTFTAPDYATEPREAVTSITSKNPSHPACSFFYPQLERLPRIAVVNIELISEDGKMRSGRDDATFHSSRTNSERSDLLESRVVWPHNSFFPLKENPKKGKKKLRKVRKRDKHTAYAQGRNYPAKPLQCIVSEWAEWSPCDKVCGIGESRRSRTVSRKAINGGAQCPPLEERRWCGSFSTCKRKHFDWSR